MDTPELDAFVAECEAAERTLAGVDEAAWARRALGQWSLKELTAHLVRGVRRVDEYLDADPGGDTPAHDRVSYWRYDSAATSTAVAERARAEAAAVEAAELPAAFSDGWRRSAERARAAPADRLIATMRGPMRLDEYLATRVLEVVVHHMDVRAALDLPAASDPTAARLTMQLLEGLLGSPRPRNMGRTRFLLAATGRIDVDDPRMPVLT